MDITNATRISLQAEPSGDTTFPDVTHANYVEYQNDGDDPDNTSLHTPSQEGGGELSQPSSVVEDEFTPLEYARLNGLCEDFTSHDPLELFASPAKPESFVQDLKDPEGVFRLDPLIPYFLPERLEIPEDAKIFIQSALILPQNQFLETMPAEKSHSKHLKLEVPLLSTDNELDVLHFGRLVFPDLENVAYPRENVDIEKDEGLEWPSVAYNFSQSFQREIECKKLEVDDSATKYLLSVVQVSSVEEEMDALLEAELKYVKVCEKSATSS
jgi:hypothetical protein